MINVQYIAHQPGPTLRGIALPFAVVGFPLNLCRVLFCTLFVQYLIVARVMLVSLTENGCCLLVMRSILNLCNGVSDVKARLIALRGKNMADSFSWSYKRY